MPGALIATTILCAQVAAHATSRMNVFIDERKAGSVAYRSRPDGTVTSNYSVMNDGITLRSFLHVQLAEDGSIRDFTVRHRQTVFGVRDIVLRGDKVKYTYTDKGEPKTIEYPFAFKGTAFFGALHLHLLASLVRPVKWVVGEAQTVRGYSFETSAESDATVTPLGEKMTTAGTARLYHVVSGPSSVDLAMKDGQVVGVDVYAGNRRFLAPGWESLFLSDTARV